MSALSISLIGPFQASLNGRPVDGFRTSKVQALLIYLLVSAVGEQAQRVAREQVMTMLWPEMPQKSARTNLRQTLYQLRKLIPEAHSATGEPVPFIHSDRQHIWVSSHAYYQLDIVTFAELLNEGRPEQLAQAVDLYRGDFLADFYLEDSNEFESWAAGWRSRLHRQVLDALERLVEVHLESGDPDQAATYARRQLQLDNLRESAHRQLIIALSRMGKRAEALRQYERCCRLLREELGVAPAPETEAAAATIRLGRQAREARARLPVPETPLIGRETELADITTLLRDGARLVSIVGPGGIGKTRLALEAARWLEPDGVGQHAGSLEEVYFLNLASLSESEELVSTIAKWIEPNFGETDREGLRQRLLDYLQSRKLLLVLDNFEHLLAEATLLKEILQVAPGVKLLVTSRERLRLQAEHVYPLSGLAYSEWTTPVEAARYPAVQLFLQHVRRVRPAFRLRTAHLAPLREIVALTEGMPLALILAAGWVKVLGPAEIAAELVRSLDFLEATHRDVPARHRSMRAVFTATWDGLSAAEQSIFAALSVFRGGFTLDAARAVTGATPHDLIRLSDRSLISCLVDGRFEVHELLRQFAAERLNEREKAEAVRHAHSAYYCGFLHKREEALKGPRVDEATAEITTDLDNIRAAWTWAVNNAQAALLGQAANGLGLYADRRHLLQEVPARLLQASEALVNVAAVSPLTRARLLSWSGLLLSFNSVQTRQPEQHARRALAFTDEAAAAGEDVREERALAHMALGSSRRMGLLERHQNLETSLALFSELGLRWEMALVHERLAATIIGKADYRRAIKHYRQASRLFAAVRHRPFSLFMKVAMARVGVFIGRTQEAETVLRQGTALFEESDDRPYLAVTQLWLGEVLIYCGRFREARSTLGMLEEMEMTWSNPQVKHASRLLSNWATVHAGRYRNVREAAAGLLSAAQEKQDQYDIGLTSLLLGCASLALDRDDEARAHLRESVEAFAAIDQREELGWALAGLGYVAMHAGDVGAARKHLLDALRYVPEYHHFACALIALPAAALLFAQIGQKERAMELHALANRHGFVANSRWFADVAGRHLDAVAETLPVEEVEAARARGEEQDLWDTMADLIQVLKRMVP